MPNASGATLCIGAARLHIRILAPDVARIRIERLGTDEPDRSFDVARTDWPPTPFERTDTDDTVVLSTAQMTITVRKADGAFTISTISGTSLFEEATVAWNGEGFRLSWTQPAQRHAYGVGEQAGSLERRGHAMELWNTDHYAFDVDATTLYQSISVCMTLDGGEANGFFLDNTFRQRWDLGERGATTASIEADGGVTDLYVFASGTPRGVLARYTELTGRMALPPLWALGYQQSRYSYYPESEVREIARKFRERSVPCDVLYLDIHYMDAYKCFTWDRERFPDPKRMLSDLRAQGFRVVTIIDPGVKVEEGYPVYEQLSEAGFYIKNPDTPPSLVPSGRATASSPTSPTKSVGRGGVVCTPLSWRTGWLPSGTI
jgi:alpha-glucosidase